MRVLHGFACGALSMQLLYTVLIRSALHRPQDPVLLSALVLAILLNGYYAFRPVKGAEDDSGEGCQSECGSSQTRL